MTKPGARGILYLCGLVVGTLIVSTGATWAQQNTSRVSLVLLCIDGLTLSDVTSGLVPQVETVFVQGACALLNNNVAGGANLASSYLTLGTGARAKVIDRQPGYMAEDYFPTEDGTALEVLQRRLGNGPPGKVVQPGIASMAAANNNLGYTVELGALGSALLEAGYTAAVIGCADTDTWERPLVNMFMDRSGSVPHGYLGPELLARDPSGPFGHWTSTEKVLAAVQRYKERVHIIAVEWADLYRVEKYAPYCEPAAAASMRAEALKRLDQFTALLLAEFSPSESLIMIISPSSKVEGSARVQGLTPIAVWGPDMGSGYLVSPTTRRPGLVANIDVPASILAYFRLPVSNSIIGRPISLVPAQKKLEGLTSLEVRATYSYVQRPLMLRLFIGYLIATLALSILATLLHRRLLSHAVQGLLLAGITLPLAFLVLPLLPPLSPILMVAVTMAIALFPTVAAYGSISNRVVFWLVATSTIIMLVVDVIGEQRLVGSSLLGYCFISGARYYGLGNEYMGIFMGASLAAVGLALEHWRLKIRTARSVMLVVAVAGSYFLGASRLGANAGGTLAFAGGAWASYLWLDSCELRWREVLRGLIMGFIVLLILVLADRYLAKDSSHIGQAFELTRQQGLPALAGIFRRKVSMNLKLVRYSLWSRVLLMLILTLSTVFFGPYRRSLRLQRNKPTLTGCLRGAVIAAILALIANDSGVVAGATALLFPTVLLILIALPCSDKTGAKISKD